MHSQAETCEINISPMIDLVFILLIFFIVTTVFVEKPGVKVHKPVAVMAKDLEKNSILFAITDSNQVVYGGKEIGLIGIRSLVARLTQKGQMPVIMEVDEKTSAGTVVRAVDEAKLGGAESVSIATEH